MSTRPVNGETGLASPGKAATGVCMETKCGSLATTVPEKKARGMFLVDKEEQKSFEISWAYHIGDIRIGIVSPIASGPSSLISDNCTGSSTLSPTLRL